ncbi:hypothetical protein [Clostridium celatum]|uniref:hypothetical protein n=1 Tax=Clostridium celatum TaxID=36834 RepID=UPI00290318D2|nr:hypothetical protein [Clostridium celatum]MDU2266756.1 hypothetical protein [Clostridium celatum]MDU6297232.1 hypothetical protein [Clostridium celatum]
MQIQFISKPREYFKSLNISSNELHIFISSTLEQYIKNNLFSDKKMNIVLFKDIEKILYPKWNNTIEVIRMTSILRDIIDKLDISFKEKVSYLKDIDNILKVIRYLSELGVKEVNNLLIEKDKILTKKEKDIINIYTEFIKDEKIEELLGEFTQPINSEIFASKIQDFNNRVKGIDGELSNISKLYIYNDAKLDMKTCLMLKILQTRGIDVVFRVYFTKEVAENCPNYYELYKSICENDEIESRTFTSNFMKYLSGHPIKKNFREDIAFKNFENPSRFKQYLREYPLEKKHTYSGVVGRQYVAISSDILNEYFKDVIFEDTNGNEDIFSYDEGNFLINLYNLVPQEDDFKITFNDLFKCVTSGWVEVKSGNKYISGKRAATLLIDLQEYFNGCETIGDYLSRIDSLELLDQFKNEFDKLGESKVQKDRVKRYLMNPLRVFSYLNSDRYEVTIKQFRDIIYKFKRMATTLLHDDMLDVNEHLSSLREIWDNVSFNCEESESNLGFSRVSSALSFKGEDYELMSFQEMRSLLIAIISNKDIGDGTDTKIKSLFTLEGIILEDVKEISLVDLSEKSIERIYEIKEISNMLNTSFLERVINYSNLNNPLFRNLLEIHNKWINTFNDSLNYNLCILFENYNGRINILYIDGIFDNDNKSSVYNIIKNIYEVEEEVVNGTPISYFDFMEDEVELEKLKINDIGWSEDIAPIALLDLDFCPRKFFLSNILGSNPVYSSELHQQMAFTTLAALFSGGKRNDERVKDIFFKLFPQWTDTLKENLLETSYTRDINTRFKFKNINFPYYMKDIQILRSKYGFYHKVKDAYKDKNLKSTEYIKSFLEDVNINTIEGRCGTHCSMCPHQYICTKGEWAIDRVNY